LRLLWPAKTQAPNRQKALKLVIPEIHETPVPLADFGRTHFIAIGGAGMNVIARLLAAQGVEVQGSDVADSANLAQLREHGIQTWVGHDAEHVTGAPSPVETVVVSSAVREENPELAAARAGGLRVLHRSDALASLMAGQRAVAVAGAHGKTTTSAMVATVLRELGLDPSFAIGGTVVVANSDDAAMGDAGTTKDAASGQESTHIPGGHHGQSDILVAEADESDGSFLNYTPYLAIVTNVEPDHLDHYGSQEAFDAAFDAFAKRIRPGGYLIACADDKGSAQMAANYKAQGGQVITYGTAPESDVKITDVQTPSEGANAQISGNLIGNQPVNIKLQVPGLHNIRNATAAIIAAMLLDTEVTAAKAARAAHVFMGTGRRFEHRGTVNDIRLFDDYAHHPTEIEALLAGARPVAGEGRILVLFQPHLYSRTKAFADRFATALSNADLAIITGVYKAREDVDPKVGAHTIIGAAPVGTANLLAVEDKHLAAQLLASSANPGDVLLLVGAGDVTELADVVLANLA
jgi:UDP-N-acetylmuramate--alanine ligase